MIKYNNHYYDKLLMSQCIKQKYFHNGPLIKIIKTIHIQLLIKITKLIFNNILKIYGICNDIISDIKENTNLK